jgi:release factor glutamine methyltransferase
VTIHELVRGARDRFVGAGISVNHAALDAEVLARRVMGWDRARFLTERDQEASSVFLLNYEHVVERRERREPVSYITGLREFWGLDFEVTPDVLIPRPETEFIIEETLERIPEGSSPTIVDIGTGSGCLAVALAREVPAARVIATDVSAVALRVALRNADRHGVADRISFRQTSLMAGIDEPADVIVSNPPYVPSASAQALTPEVRDYEPGVALFGGDSGLDLLRQVLEESRLKLAPGGWLIMEFGCGQDDCVTALVSECAGLSLVKIRHDLQDIPRTAVVRRSS